MKKNVGIIGFGNAGSYRFQRLSGSYGVDCSNFVQSITIVDISPGAVNEKIAGVSTDMPISLYDWSGVEKARLPLDALFICTPASHHLEVFKKAVELELAPRILVEKPLAFTLDEANEMKEIANRRNVQLFCGYHLGLTGPMQRLCQRLGETGAVVTEMTVTYTKMREAGHKKRHPISGIIEEEIPHVVDLITSVMGFPKKIWGNHRETPIRVDVDRMSEASRMLIDFQSDCAHEDVFQDNEGYYCLGWIPGKITALLTFTGGRVALIRSSFETARQNRRLEIEAWHPLDALSPDYGNNFFSFEIGLTDIKTGQSVQRPYFKEWSGQAYSGAWSAACIVDEEVPLKDPLGIETQLFLEEKDSQLCSVDRAINIQRIVEAMKPISERLPAR